MHIAVVFLSLVLVSCANGVVRVLVINDVEGYYWRDFKGKIPRDAVPGGLDKNGNTTYIGQALHISPPNGKLIPGTIDAITGTFRYAWHDKAYDVTKNVKILCSQHPEQFEWIDTDIPAAQKMDQDDLVVGGYDTSYPLFIGKIHAEGEVLVGKVTLTSPYEFVGYVVNGKAHFVKTMFKILSFNSKMEKPNPSCLAADIVNITTYA